MDNGDLGLVHYGEHLSGPGAYVFRFLVFAYGVSGFLRSTRDLAEMLETDINFAN